jgi:drug/metabolite transporter (DMT)-like permease
MSPELRIVNGLAFAFVFVALALSVMVLVRARRRGTELGPPLVLSILNGCGILLLLLTNALPEGTPDWLRYGLLGASAVLVTLLARSVWRLARQRLRDVGLSRPR